MTNKTTATLFIVVQSQLLLLRRSDLTKFNNRIKVSILKEYLISFKQYLKILEDHEFVKALSNNAKTQYSLFIQQE